MYNDAEVNTKLTRTSAQFHRLETAVEYKTNSKYRGCNLFFTEVELSPSFLSANASLVLCMVVNRLHMMHGVNIHIGSLYYCYATVFRHYKVIYIIIYII
jgi:hypothetical protein